MYIIAVLIVKNACMWSLQVDQRCALFWAVIGDDLEMVRMLLDAGAYPDIADCVSSSTVLRLNCIVFSFLSLFICFSVECPLCIYVHKYKCTISRAVVPRYLPQCCGTDGMDIATCTPSMAKLMW